MTALHGFLGLPSDWDVLPCTTGAHKIDWMPVLTGLPETGGDPALASLALGLNEQAAGETLVGYSMGGRVALHMLLAEGGSRWKRAIIVSASPGLANPVERMGRLEADGRWAHRFRHEPWETVLAAWNAQAVFATDGTHPLERREADFDREQLALTLLRGSVGRQEDLRPKLATLDAPILWVAGELDEKYAALARECAALNPRFRCEIVARAGHRAPWTAPIAFCEAIGSSGSHNKNKKMPPEIWTAIKHYEDIKLERTADGVAKVTINRPEVRNAFRPQTVKEMLDAFDICRDESSIGVIILTGEGDKAFCSGGDQNVRGKGGYVDEEGHSRLNVLDLQKVIRSMPKPVVAMVAGYAIGGGHVLHVVCDLTIAADNARFGQTGPKVGSFDGGLGSSYLARIVGQKKAREIWFLCRQYDAQQALEMGLVNTVVPLAVLEAETLKWCREMLDHSQLALRCLKAALNADCDGQIGLLDLAGNATLLYYLSEEAQEGKNAYLEKRKPDFGKFGRLP